MHNVHLNSLEIDKEIEESTDKDRVDYMNNNDRILIKSLPLDKIGTVANQSNQMLSPIKNQNVSLQVSPEKKSLEIRPLLTPEVKANSIKKAGKSKYHVKIPFCHRNSLHNGKEFYLITDRMTSEPLYTITSKSVKATNRNKEGNFSFVYLTEKKPKPAKSQARAQVVVLDHIHTDYGRVDLGESYFISTKRLSLNKVYSQDKQTKDESLNEKTVNEKEFKAITTKSYERKLRQIKINEAQRVDIGKGKGKGNLEQVKESTDVHHGNRTELDKDEDNLLQEELSEQADNEFSYKVSRSLVRVTRDNSTRKIFSVQSKLYNKRVHTDGEVIHKLESVNYLNTNESLGTKNRKKEDASIKEVVGVYDNEKEKDTDGYHNKNSKDNINTRQMIDHLDDDNFAHQQIRINQPASYNKVNHHSTNLVYENKKIPETYHTVDEYEINDLNDEVESSTLNQSRIIKNINFSTVKEMNTNVTIIPEEFENGNFNSDEKNTLKQKEATSKDDQPCIITTTNLNKNEKIVDIKKEFDHSNDIRIGNINDVDSKTNDTGEVTTLKNESNPKLEDISYCSRTNKSNKEVKNKKNLEIVNSIDPFYSKIQKLTATKKDFTFEDNTLNESKFNKNITSSGNEKIRKPDNNKGQGSNNLSNKQEEEILGSFGKQDSRVDKENNIRAKKFALNRIGTLEDLEWKPSSREHKSEQDINDDCPDKVEENNFFNDLETRTPVSILNGLNFDLRLLEKKGKPKNHHDLSKFITTNYTNTNKTPSDKRGNEKPITKSQNVIKAECQYPRVNQITKMKKKEIPNTSKSVMNLKEGESKLQKLKSSIQTKLVNSPIKYDKNKSNRTFLDKPSDHKAKIPNESRQRQLPRPRLSISPIDKKKSHATVVQPSPTIIKDGSSLINRMRQKYKLGESSVEKEILQFEQESPIVEIAYPNKDLHSQQMCLKFSEIMNDLRRRNNYNNETNFHQQSYNDSITRNNNNDHHSKAEDYSTKAVTKCGTVKQQYDIGELKQIYLSYLNHIEEDKHLILKKLREVERISEDEEDAYTRILIKLNELVNRLRNKTDELCRPNCPDCIRFIVIRRQIEVDNQNKVKLFFNLDEMKEKIINLNESRNEDNDFIFNYSLRHQKVPLIKNKEFVGTRGGWCSIYPSNEVDYADVRSREKINSKLMHIN